jgi:TRAP transporter TAXI family solute receptor
MRVVVLTAFTVGIGIGVTSAPATGATPEYSTLSKGYVVSFATGAQGGSFYNLGAGISSVVTESVKGLTVGAETSGGTTENINLVGQKEAEFGFAAADVVLEAYESTGTFKGVGYDNIRFVMATFAQPFQVVVLADSKIKTLDDLKGKNISIGPEGAPFTMTNFIKHSTGYEMNKDYKGQYLSHSQAAEALGDGTIDAIVISVGVPVSAISELATTHAIRIISLTDQDINKLTTASKLYIPRTIAADTYKGVNYDVKTVETPVLVISNSDTPAEVVYHFIKATLEGHDRLVSINASASAITLQNATSSAVIPIHDGAKAYFEENGAL